MADQSGIKKIIGGVIIILLIAIISISIYNTYLGVPKKINYLVPHVPYHGIYNHINGFYSSPTLATLTILEYYGDKRYTVRQLLERLEFQTQGNPSYIQNLAQFFKENGYEIAFGDPSKTSLEQIKEYINPQKKIPVMILAKRSEDPLTKHTQEQRVVIGVLDDQKKLIVHDIAFGNNYALSYDDFQKTYVPNSILAVWPSQDLGSQISGINANYMYPPRLRAMDIVGPLFIERMDAAYLAIIDKNYEEALALFNKIVQDPRFNNIHPVMQLVIYFGLASVLESMEKTDELIALMNDKSLPINHDLDKNYDGWKYDLKTEFPTLQKPEFSLPYIVLSNAYTRKGDLKKAREYYDKAFDLHPGYLMEVEQIPSNSPILK